MSELSLFRGVGCRMKLEIKDKCLLELLKLKDELHRLCTDEDYRKKYVGKANMGNK